MLVVGKASCWHEKTKGEKNPACPNKSIGPIETCKQLNGNRANKKNVIFMSENFSYKIFCYRIWNLNEDSSNISWDLLKILQDKNASVQL